MNGACVGDNRRPELELIYRLNSYAIQYLDRITDADKRACERPMAMLDRRVECKATRSCHFNDRPHRHSCHVSKHRRTRRSIQVRNRQRKHIEKDMQLAPAVDASCYTVTTVHGQPRAATWRLAFNGERRAEAKSSAECPLLRRMSEVTSLS